MLDRRSGFFSIIFFAATLLSLTSCAGPLFKVKPVVELPPIPETAKTTEAGGVTMKVAPLMTDEESQRLFEANLPLNGILAVRLDLSFQNGVALELKKLKFRVHDGQGREWKWLSPKKAASRILKANGISLYNPNSRKQFEQDLAAYGIDLTTALSSGDSHRQGFLFFQSPDKHAVTLAQQFTLVVDKLPQPISIGLN